MITPIITFLSTRIVFTVVTVVVAAGAVAVPVVVAIHGNTVTITAGAAASTSRHHDDEERARIIVEVQNAGDAVIVKLNDAEATCDVQISQLAGQSKLSAAATAAAIKKGKDDFHAQIAPYLDEIKADEDELEHMTVVTTQTEQTFLVRIREVEVIALGQTGHTGTVVTVCQTIIVEVRTVIVVVVQPPGGDEGDDARFAPLLR